ncbi:MAG: cytochrome c1, partial [Geminicoccaceae bacterium]
MAENASPNLIKAASLAAALLGVAVGFMPAQAADAPAVASQKWSFSAPFGTFDRGQLQRGFKVYQEVCAACHGMKLLHYRN